MTSPGGRSASCCALAVLTAVVGVLLFGYAGRSPAAAPGRTSEVAAATSEPAATAGHAPARFRADEPIATIVPGASDRARRHDRARSRRPQPEPEPSTPVDPPTTTGLIAGSVDRASLDLSATYNVNAEITVGTGELDVATTLVVRNVGTRSIDRLELNTVAARLGRLKVTPRRSTIARSRSGSTTRPCSCRSAASSSRASRRPSGSPTARRCGSSISGSDWMFSALRRHARAVPLDPVAQPGDAVRPTEHRRPVRDRLQPRGQRRAPDRRAARPRRARGRCRGVRRPGSGKAWAFTLHDVRDVALVLAPDFVGSPGQGRRRDRPAYSQGGDFAATRLLDIAMLALREEHRILGDGLSRGRPCRPWRPRAARRWRRPGRSGSPERSTRSTGPTSSTRGWRTSGSTGSSATTSATTRSSTRRPPTSSPGRPWVRSGRRAARGSPLDGSIAKYQGRCYYEVVLRPGRPVPRRRPGADRAPIATGRRWRRSSRPTGSGW